MKGQSIEPPTVDVPKRKSRIKKEGKVQQLSLQASTLILRVLDLATISNQLPKIAECSELDYEIS